MNLDFVFKFPFFNKHDVTGVSKYNFLFEHMQYISFTHNKVHWQENIFTVLFWWKYDEVYALREKCPYSQIFWFVFSCIWIEYRKILRISPYSDQMRGNADLKNSDYRHFSRSDDFGRNGMKIQNNDCNNY